MKTYYMNEKLNEFINEEIKKLHKITLLKEEKAKIQKGLKLLEAIGKMPVQGTPEWHQFQIAKKTMKMNDAAASVMGGMTKSEAKKILDKYGYKFNQY